MKKKNILRLIGVLLICCSAVFFAGCRGDQTVKNKLYPVVKDGKWGYIDNQGKIVIEPQFDMARDFHDGLALVTKNDRSGNIDPITKQPPDPKDGYIDETGKFVIEPKFISQKNLPEMFLKPSAENFSEGLAIVQTDWSLEKSGASDVLQRNYACIDKTGKVVFKLDQKYRITDNFSDGLLLFKQESDQKYGYLDKTGKVAIEPKFVTAFPFREGLAAVSSYSEKDGKKDVYFGYIDPTGKTAIEFQFKSAGDFHEGLARISVDGEFFGFIDKTGRLIIEKRFKAAGDFHDGLVGAPHIAGAGYDFADKSGKNTLTSPAGIALSNFSEGLAVVADDRNKLQIIDKTGKPVAAVGADVAFIPNQTIIGDFEGGLVKIIADEKGVKTLFYFNKKGTAVWKEKLAGS